MDGDNRMFRCSIEIRSCATPLARPVYKAITPSQLGRILEHIPASLTSNGANLFCVRVQLGLGKRQAGLDVHSCASVYRVFYAWFVDRHRRTSLKGLKSICITDI